MKMPVIKGSFPISFSFFLVSALAFACAASLVHESVELFLDIIASTFLNSTKIVRIKTLGHTIAIYVYITVTEAVSLFARTYIESYVYRLVYSN